jgi:hypothetical protein
METDPKQKLIQNSFEIFFSCVANPDSHHYGKPDPHRRQNPDTDAPLSEIRDLRSLTV